MLPYLLAIAGGYLIGSAQEKELFAKGGAVANRKVGVAKRLKIKNWYTKTYPTDDLGEEINPDITFWSLWTYMSQGYDVYDILGVGDSIVRERVFEKLSEILDVDYDYVYQVWLKSDKYAKGGEIKYNHKIKVNGNIIDLALSRSYVTGTDGKREYMFIDKNGEPYTGYGFSVKEALKSIEEYQSSF